MKKEHIILSKEITIPLQTKIRSDLKMYKGFWLLWCIRNKDAQKEDIYCNSINFFFTSSVCPVTLTFSQTKAIFPEGSIRNVVRLTPIYFLPYILFSCQTPYASSIFFSVSLNKTMSSLCLSMNVQWLLLSSGLTPTTTVFNPSN